MPQDLKDLLELHAFCREALERRALMPAEGTEKLKAWQARAFSDIFAYKSNNPKITLAQIRFALSCIADEAPKSEDAATLRSAIEKQNARLTRLLDDSQRQQRCGAINNPQVFDALSDRVGIFDRGYRYQFTNTANLTFHDSDPAYFKGRPNWEISGLKFFEQVNKPRFDACFAGQTVHCFSHNPVRHRSRLFWATYSPIRNADGHIDSVLMVSREVTDLNIPDDLIVRI